MDDKIINFLEYENFLNKELKKVKTNFPYDLVEFINLEKNGKLDKNKFLELLPQINYNNIKFYENRIKELNHWKENKYDLNKNEKLNFKKFLWTILEKTIELKEALSKIHKDFIENIIENTDIKNYSEWYIGSNYEDDPSEESNVPIFRAIENNNKEIVQLLIKHGANVNYKMQNLSQINTPIQWAVNYSNSDIVELLIQNGANVKIMTHDYDTLLHFAFKNKEMIDLLINHGINISLENKQGKTIIDKAVWNGQNEIVRYLIKKCEGNRINMNYNKALFYATKQNNYELILFLLEKGANINYIDSSYLDPNGSSLHYAIWNYNKNMTKLLLQCGINPNIQNKYSKETPLHYAIKKQYDNTINELFTKNYIRNYTSQRFLKGELRNEIYLGQRKYCKDIVELLLKYGANVNIKDKYCQYSQTPLEMNKKRYGKENENLEVSKLLKEAEKIQKPWEEIDFKSFENLSLQDQPSTSKSPQM